jgi:uncharacterized protein
MQRLLDAYGDLLTEHQRSTLALYLDRDWSYAEIATAQGVSRTAVYDLVRRSEALLTEYDGKLGLLADGERRESHRKRLDRRIETLESELANLRKAVKDLT